uniref:Uncharacterized protein n=1 Tax=Meloidogyne hapla TaxID=6305 RepID=A0A1I8BZ21_MELHA
MDDLLECIFNDIKNTSAQMLRKFQRAMNDLQSSQTALFRKELPEYLSNFEFGTKFVQLSLEIKIIEK